MAICVLPVVFFFQAEDGIRDTSVTGVQTCALPISVGLLVGRHYPYGSLPVYMTKAAGWAADTYLPPTDQQPKGFWLGYEGLTKMGRMRSEERRVGKECRSRW